MNVYISMYSCMQNNRRSGSILMSAGPHSLILLKRSRFYRDLNESFNERILISLHGGVNVRLGFVFLGSGIFFGI